MYLRKLKVHNLFHPLMHSTNLKDHPADAASMVANLIGHVEQHPLLKASDNIIAIVHEDLSNAWRNVDMEGVCVCVNVCVCVRVCVGVCACVCVCMCV